MRERERESTSSILIHWLIENRKMTLRLGTTGFRNHKMWGNRKELLRKEYRIK